MTEKECLKKCRELIRNGGLADECIRLMKSGGIDVSGAVDSYVVPRIIVSTALMNTADSTIIERYEKERKNLLRF